MPARIGIMSERLLPLAPWQAAQVMTLAKPALSSGPAAAAGPPRRARTRAPEVAALARRVIMAGVSSGQHVGPDALPPALGALGHGDALGRGELLLDLDHLAVLDLVGVDDGNRLAVADPAVAGIAGRH